MKTAQERTAPYADKLMSGLYLQSSTILTYTENKNILMAFSLKIVAGMFLLGQGEYGTVTRTYW